MARAGWSLFFLGLVALPGCTSSLREVMLVVETDTPCTVANQIEIRVARGRPELVTYSQRFAREECPQSAGPTALPTVRLGMNQSFRLGIVDGRRNDDRLFVEVHGLGPAGIAVRSSAATDFQDDRVPALPVFLSLVCVNASPCPAGQVCEADAENNAACVDVYVPPDRLPRINTE